MRDSAADPLAAKVARTKATIHQLTVGLSILAHIIVGKRKDFQEGGDKRGASQVLVVPQGR